MERPILTIFAVRNGYSWAISGPRTFFGDPTDSLKSCTLAANALGYKFSLPDFTDNTQQVFLSQKTGEIQCVVRRTPEDGTVWLLACFESDENS